jgi:hypothetical protein
MSKKYAHKKQHWVPRSYLAAWCDAAKPANHTPYVWTFPRDGGDAKNKAPEGIFTEPNLYTIRREDGSRDLSLENGLSELESKFSNVRRSVIAKQQTPSDEDRQILITFAAASFARTRSQRDHQQSQWGNVLAMMDQVKEQLQSMTPDDRGHFAWSFARPSKATGINHEEVKRLAESPLQHTLDISISAQVALLSHLNLAILWTDDSFGFITSDAPCVWFDPEWHKQPTFYQAPSLSSPTIEITLPLSPNHLLLISHSGPTGYRKVTMKVVDEFNRRTRFYAKDTFVANRNEAKACWYDVGMPPSNT